jgi:transcriptional regulator with XRE-family HTH domain
MARKAGTAQAGAEPVAAADDTDKTVREIGTQIRRLRTRRRMTLNDVSEETGISVSMLSMLERGVATPSIGTLVAVTSALGSRMSDLFDGADVADRSPVSRLADQVEMVTGAGVLRRLIHDERIRGMELVMNEYEPGTSSGDELTHHGGAEFGVVISGTLKVELDDQVHVLKTGDGIGYDSTRPHRISNVGRTKARAVWVNLDD